MNNKRVIRGLDISTDQQKSTSKQKVPFYYGDAIAISRQNSTQILKKMYGKNWGEFYLNNRSIISKIDGNRKVFRHAIRHAGEPFPARYPARYPARIIIVVILQLISSLILQYNNTKNNFLRQERKPS